MPIKSRMTEDKISNLSTRKIEFENQLSDARKELEKVQNEIVKGSAETAALISIQNRIKAIETTISRVETDIAELEADLIEQKRSEKKREIVSKIKALDIEAENAGNRFTELYANVESLSYKRILEMSVLIARIADLKADFNRQIVSLIPDAQRLKRRDLPEVQSELDNLLAELLQNDCKLNILRSEGVFSVREYATDDFHAFRLPANDLREWIFLSIPIIKKHAQGKPETEKAGFFSKVIERIS